MSIPTVRRGLATALAAAIAFGLPVLLAQPANALPGLQYAQAQSANDSSPSKFIQASCPAGTVGVGGSALIAGTSAARVNYAYPSANGYVVTAVEPRGGIPENWQLYVNAICVAAPSGLEYRSASSTLDSASSHSAVASCSTGKKVIGMGGGVDTYTAGIDFHDVVLNGIRSQATLDSVTAAGYEDEVGATGYWDVTATAVCANANAVANLSLASTVSSSTPGAAHSAVASCPAGTKVHSGGFVAIGAGGQAQLASMHFSLDTGHDNGGIQGFEADGHTDLTGFTGNWSMLSQAICAA